MMRVEESCLRPTLQLHCPLKACKAIRTPPPLYVNVVIAGQPFKLPIGLLFDHVATGGVVDPLWCDASRVVMP